MKRKKKIVSISAYMLGLLLLVTACYKEDISTLYSRQYQLSTEITGLNAEILRINNEIIDLRNLYTILANKPTTTGYEYRVTADGDTIGIDIMLDSSKFFIPYGRNGKNGADGRTPVISISPDGYWVINGQKSETKARGEKGDKGDLGKDGRTPVITISPDGYWVIDGVKTTAKAQGDKGDKGDPGKDGVTPLIGISPDGYWMIDGVKTTTKAQGEKGDKGDKGDLGKDGRTLVVSISPDGYWVIDGVKTTTKAQGEKGDKGDPGTNGRTPVVSISPDGYWVIDGVKTATKAQGDKGDPGKDGKTPVVSISSDGYWVIDGVKTTVKARGEDGANGKDGVDGTTPTISISPDGYWVINGQKTEWKAVGKDGTNGTSPTVAIVGGYWTINGVSTGVPATGPKGDPGKDGKTPVITISPDGYWVIDGTKSTSKAVPDDGRTPLINAAKDPDNPADENYYWTIKYPGDADYTFLLVDGHKVPATGPKGDKGDQGDTPVVEPVIESVVEAEDGTSITINLHDGTSYEIPLLGINFKLNPGNLSLKDRNGLDSLLLFTREGQTMDVPYICSPNVERIEAMLPAGWSMRADISPTDSTKRIIHLTAPQLMDLDRSQFEGGATFIAFDQKGASVTQFIKLKLKKYMYINFFYNPLNTVETNRPTSPLNSIGFSDRERLHLRLYSLEGKDLQLYGAFDAGNVARGQDPLESVLHQYPSLVFNKNEKDVEKMFKGVGAVFNSDSLDLQLKDGEDKPQNIRYCNPEWEPVNPRKWILKPVPHETYMAQFSFEMNNGSNNETMRLKRASAEWYIDVAKASELFGFKDNKDAFDYTKMVIRLSMQAVYLYSDFTATTSGYTEARPNTMSYDKEKDVLTCRFCTLGSTSSQFEVFFYYDGVGKKTFKTNLVRLVSPDMRMSLFLNQGVERQGYTYMNASLLYDAANERTTISETRYGLKDFDVSQDLPFNP